MRKIKDSVIKIQDLSKEEQTDKVKLELYNLTKQFVYKYWRDYYVQYKGDLDDLVVDFYSQFMTAKSRVKGKEESLLDKFDPSITTLPYLVKVAVKRMLIDRSRKDKGEVNYAEKYDDETGEMTLDFLASKIDDPDVQLEDIEFSDDELLELRDLFDELPERKRNYWLKSYRECKNVLSPNYRALFKDLAGF